MLVLVPCLPFCPGSSCSSHHLLQLLLFITFSVYIMMIRIVSITSIDDLIDSLIGLTKHLWPSQCLSGEGGENCWWSQKHLHSLYDRWTQNQERRLTHPWVKGHVAWTQFGVHLHYACSSQVYFPLTSCVLIHNVFTVLITKEKDAPELFLDCYWSQGQSYYMHFGKAGIIWSLLISFLLRLPGEILWKMREKWQTLKSDDCNNGPLCKGLYIRCCNV